MMKEGYLVNATGSMSPLSPHPKFLFQAWERDFEGCLPFSRNLVTALGALVSNSKFSKNVSSFI
jgi:hypothetical protein